MPIVKYLRSVEAIVTIWLVGRTYTEAMRGDVNWRGLLRRGRYLDLSQSAIFATVLANGDKFFHNCVDAFRSRCYSSPPRNTAGHLKATQPAVFKRTALTRVVVVC